MLSQCLVPSITKKSFLTRWFWDNNHLQPFKCKIFIKVFQSILKSMKTFLIQNYFYSNAKNYKTKNVEKNLIQIPQLKNIKLF